MITNEKETVVTLALKKQKLFHDDTYGLLIRAQERILDHTGIRVSLRKLLDKLITPESVQALEAVLIQKLNSLTGKPLV